MATPNISQPGDPNENQHHVDLTQEELDQLHAQSDAAIDGSDVFSYDMDRDANIEWNLFHQPEPLKAVEAQAEATAAEIAADLGDVIKEDTAGISAEDKEFLETAPPLVSDEALDHLQVEKVMAKQGPLATDETLDRLHAEQVEKELGPLATDEALEGIKDQKIVQELGQIANDETIEGLRAEQTEVLAPQGSVDASAPAEAGTDQPAITGKAAEIYMGMETPAANPLEQKLDEAVFPEVAATLDDTKGIESDIDAAFGQLEASEPAEQPLAEPTTQAPAGPNPVEALEAQPLEDITAQMTANVDAQSQTDLPIAPAAPVEAPMEPVPADIRPELAAMDQPASTDAATAALENLKNGGSAAEQSQEISAELDQAIDNLGNESAPEAQA